ncbi:MAG: HD domain-containing protein [Nitrospirae bacterium]|nr:HD domain-containing protein [Nitrospirota bacterium]
MKQENLHIPLSSMISAISAALDLVSPLVVDHHRQVAYLASHLSEAMGLSQELKAEITAAAALHDAGALSLKERLDILNFEILFPHRHAEAGYLLTRSFEPFSNIAEIIRYHHLSWNDGAGARSRGGKVPVGSHILHLSDRVAVLINRHRNVIGQVKGIKEKILRDSGRMFMPEVVEAFMEIAERESFWFDASSPSPLGLLIEKGGGLASFTLDMKGLCSLSMIFRQIVDFRSRFTSVHSSGVSATSEALAGCTGFTGRECRMMGVAGQLHDLGKLAVSSEILEKPARLTRNEFSIIRSHTFHTHRILAHIEALDVINAWASFHHERLDGNGYPFHHTDRELPKGSRIIAISDVFTALTEDRPYRRGMKSADALRILERMAKASRLDAELVSALVQRYDEIDAVRMDAQNKAAIEYEEFEKSLEAAFAEQ